MSIYRFRSIESLNDLRISSPTLLAGHNDAGKTAIIDALRFLLGDYAITDQDPTLALDSRADGDGVSATGLLPSSDAIETTVEGFFTPGSADGDLRISEPTRLRRVFRDGRVTLELHASVPANEGLRDIERLKVSDLREALTKLGLSSTGLKDDLRKRLSEAVASEPHVEEWIPAPAAYSRALPRVQFFNASNAIDAESAIQATLQTAYRSHLSSEKFQGNIRQLETELEESLTKSADAIRNHIETQCSDIGTVNIRPLVSFKGGINGTEITVTNPAGESINLRKSGSGRARRVALAVWEYNSLLLKETLEDAVLLYDEPDTHLDYANQRDFMRLVHEQSKLPNVNIVIATHSMNLIDGTDINDVISVKHVAQRTVTQKLTDDSEVGPHLGSLAASVGLRNTVLLHERLFVGVEGETEVRVLPVLFKLLTGLHLESFGIALWACENNEGAVKFTTFLVKNGRSVAFVVDRDSIKNSKHIFNEEKLRKNGLDPDQHCLYLGDPNELEELFTDEQWAQVANEKWPRDGGNRAGDHWEAKEFKNLRSGKFSQLALDLLRDSSTQGPGGKPEMLRQFALALTSPADVPAALAAVFEELIERANS
ncbi:AAA family ATPase [Rhodococcus hoagii]|nr:AAA family ATPase [Prescottella equi]